MCLGTASRNLGGGRVVTHSPDTSALSGDQGEAWEVPVCVSVLRPVGGKVAEWRLTLRTRVR